MRLNSKIWITNTIAVAAAVMVIAGQASAEPKVREITDFPPTKPAEGSSLTDGIPHGRSGLGAGKFFDMGVMKAWFAAPTDRYSHGVLGDGIEAGGGIIQPPASGAPSAFMIKGPDDSAFEDIQPRGGGFDGEGILDIVGIRSHPNPGGPSPGNG